MPREQKAVVGVIGGSGLYEIQGLTDIEEVHVDTPFGQPSDRYIRGRLGDVDMIFLPRHGRGHRLSPTHIPYRANIHGMKQLGVEWIISVSAVGSMREEIAPGHIVLPDQFYDRTVYRAHSFFDQGVVIHVQFADPICPDLLDVLYRASKDLQTTVHRGGTYLCIEGPQFSTRAESHIYRHWGVDVIGMTNATEARLAREAEICYATIALSTDYDCWRAGEEDVSVEQVVETIKKNVSAAKSLIAAAVPLIPQTRACSCGSALKNAILSDLSGVSPETRQRYELFLRKYLP